jgi:hypothetical protein
VSSVARDARLMLDAWRECGADRVDPVRFRFIEALDRRAAGHSGEARRILDNKLSILLAAYADGVERAASKGADVGAGAPFACDDNRGPLAGLIGYMDRRASADCDGADAGGAVAPPSSYPKLEALDYFREIWTKVSTERQLRQSLAQVPGNAGPLNSSSLVHRSLSLMRELSPGYLEQFLSYVDALSWMDEMNGGGALVEKVAPRTGGGRKSGRGKLR